MIIKLSRVNLLSQRIETILTGRKRPITYETLCCIIHSKYGIRYRRNSKWICKALDTLVMKDALEGKPPRSALVIREDTGQPGPGFYISTSYYGYQYTDNKVFWKDAITQLAA